MSHLIAFSVFFFFLFFSGQAPTDFEGIIMELLRAFVVLLGVSMFFSIITSVLTASEDLRVNFPSGKYLGASNNGSPDTTDDMRTEDQNNVEDLDAKLTVDREEAEFDDESKNYQKCQNGKENGNEGEVP